MGDDEQAKSKADATERPRRCPPRRAARARGLVVALGLAVVAASCYRTRIEVGDTLRRGQGAKEAYAQPDDNPWVDGAFYHNGVLGLVDFSGPIRLDQICAAGVDHIDQRTGFLAGLVGSVTYSLYTPQNVRITCAEPAGGPGESPRPAED